MNQHLHNQIGNCVGEAKRRLYDNLKKDADIEDAVATFIAELRLGLEVVIREQKLKSETRGNIN